MKKTMYKLKQKEQPKRTLFWILLISLITVLTTGAYFIIQRNSSSEENQYTASSKVAEGESKDTRVTDSPEKSPPVYEGDDVNNTESLSGVLTHNSITDGKLVIRNVINQSFESGECTLTLTKGGDIITEKAAVVNDPTSSTCQGFDIPVSKLSNGTWKIVIDITDNTGRTGKISGEVTI